MPVRATVDIVHWVSNNSCEVHNRHPYFYRTNQVLCGLNTGILSSMRLPIFLLGLGHLIYVHHVFHPCTSQSSWIEYEDWEDWTINGWTVPLCSSRALCGASQDCSYPGQSMGMTCKCEPTCSYFKDCCIDYLQLCTVDNIPGEGFIDAVRDTDLSQFSCLSLPSSRTYTGSFLVVAQCSYDWKDAGIRQKCERPYSEEDPLTMIPLAYLNAVTYKNVYCLICNDKSVSDAVPWRIDATCSREFENITTTNVSIQNVQDLMMGCWSWNFGSPNSQSSARSCRAIDINDCDVNSENASLIALSVACTSYSAVFQSYKNPHCYVCSNLQLNATESIDWPAEIMSRMSCYVELLRESKLEYPIGSYPISILFDFTSIDGLANYRGNDQRTDGLEEGELPNSCENYQVLDPFSNICINLTCESGYQLINKSCVRAPGSNNTCSVGNSSIYITMACFPDTNRTSVCAPCWPLTNDSVSFLYESFDFLDDTQINGRIVEKCVYSGETNMTTMCGKGLAITGYARQSVQYPAAYIHETVVSSATRILSSLNAICPLSNLLITVGCDDLRDDCPRTFFSVHEIHELMDNKTDQFILATTNATSTSINSFYAIQYTANESSNVYSKNETLHICKRPSITCPLVSLNASLFEELSDGYILYLRENKTFSPNQYTRINNSTIQVCLPFEGSEHDNFLQFSGTQALLSLIGGCLSIAALLATFITYMKFKTLRKSTCSQLTLSFSVSLILAQLLLLTSGLASGHPRACTSMAVIGHYAWLAVFSHTMVLALDLHRRFGGKITKIKPDDGAAMLVRSLLLAWGIPLFIVIPCLSVFFSRLKIAGFTLLYGTRTCWIGDGYVNLYVFGIPVAVIILVNIVLFTMVVLGLHAKKKSTAMLNNTARTKSVSDPVIYLKMSTLLGFTWLFGFIAAFADTAVLWYIFIVLNSLQGVYVFIAFICNQRVFKLWRDVCVFKRGTSQPQASFGTSTTSDNATPKWSLSKTVANDNIGKSISVINSSNDSSLALNKTIENRL